MMEYDYLRINYFEMLSREIPRQRNKDQEKLNKKYKRLREKALKERDWAMYCYYSNRIM